MYGNWARAASAVLGVWLFLSIFLFPHTPQQFTNTWLCGLLAIAFSVMAFFVPKMRYALVVLGAWVFFTAFAIPAGSGEVIWNNAVVGALLFAFGLARSRTAHPGPFSHHRRMPV